MSRYSLYVQRVRAFGVPLINGRTYKRKGNKMTFRLKDVRPKTGPVINVKPYQGIKRYGNINPRVIDNRRAIARMRETRGNQ